MYFAIVLTNSEDAECPCVLVCWRRSCFSLKLRSLRRARIKRSKGSDSFLVASVSMSLMGRARSAGLGKGLCEVAVGGEEMVSWEVGCEQWGVSSSGGVDVGSGRLTEAHLRKIALLRNCIELLMISQLVSGSGL